jgi:hypothetical protein
MLAASSRAVFGLIGTGGHARETMAFARAFITGNPDLRIDGDRIVFVDREAGAAIGGHGVICEEAFVALAAPRRFAVAMEDGVIRRRVATRAIAAGTRIMLTDLG